MCLLTSFLWRWFIHGNLKGRIFEKKIPPCENTATTFAPVEGVVHLVYICVVVKYKSVFVAVICVVVKYKKQKTENTK